MSDVPTQPMPAGPETLADGRYRLHRRLGTGGMGIVVQASDEMLGREVAVKLLADNLAADTTAHERFLREARAAASISDPHVVQVHDVGEEDGRPYLVMELVDGPSLADVVATHGPLGATETVGVAADALAGIHRAHEAGLLHRDLKPGNLLRTPTGLVKVTDFGVAKAADAAGLTREGMVIGTAPYVAPERLRGEPASVRSDLYGLGATLLELLTGRRPGPDDGPDDLPDDVPANLRHLVEALLAADPRDRPASAESALALLAGEVDPAGVGARGHAHRLSSSGPVPAGSTAIVGADPRGDETATTHVADLDPGLGDSPAGPTRGPSVSWQQAVMIATVLLAIAVGFQLFGTEETATEDAPGVEREADPADTARNLADWLEGRAE